ncbi:hypothetical protein EMIT074MI3_20992 [Bacillus licheniformis]
MICYIYIDNANHYHLGNVICFTSTGGSSEKELIDNRFSYAVVYSGQRLRKRQCVKR